MRALVLLLLLAAGCAPPTRPPDRVQIERGVDRSRDVQSETDKRVKEYNDLAK